MFEYASFKATGDNLVDRINQQVAQGWTYVDRTWSDTHGTYRVLFSREKEQPSV